MQIRTGTCADTNVICTDTDKYRYQNTYTNTYEHADRGMSLRNVSYEAFVFSEFSRSRKNTMPLIWWSFSSLLPSQAAPNLTASRHNLVAIQLSIKTSCPWQLESLRFIFIHFRLAQVTRLRQMFEMSHADLKQWRAQRVLRRRISFVQDSI